jgi:hypothetical protein
MNDPWRGDADEKAMLAYLNVKGPLRINPLVTSSSNDVRPTDKSSRWDSDNPYSRERAITLKVPGKNPKKGGLKRSKKIMKKTRKTKKSRKTKRGKKTKKSKTSKKHKRRVKKRLHSMKGGDDTDTPGHEAARQGNMQGVLNHINRGDPGDMFDRVNEQDEMGETMLYIALANRHDKIARILLDRGADLRIPINGENLIEITAENPNIFSNRGVNMIYKEALDRKIIDKATYEKYYRGLPTIMEE